MDYFDGFSYYVDKYEKETPFFDYVVEVGSIVGTIIINYKKIGYIIVRPDYDEDTIILLNANGEIIGHIDERDWDFTDAIFRSNFLYFMDAIQCLVNNATVANETDEEEPEDYGDVDE